MEVPEHCPGCGHTDWPWMCPSVCVVRIRMLVYMGSNFEELRSEILRQDGKHGPFQGTRLGRSRLALACLEDEIDEAKEAWRTERKSLHWHNARTEVLQVAAVAMRALRDAFPVPNVMREESRIVTTVQTLDASDGGTR